MTSEPRRHVAALILIAGAQFCLFEIGLRTWGSSEAAPAFQGLFTVDALSGYRLKPGARVRFATPEFDTEIAINRSGVRDDEEFGPKQPGERRIAVLGDSLVLSVQVPFEQTFGERLERRLNARQSQYRYRVINAGVQGYGPVEELFFFRRVVLPLQPDLVLHALFVGNDAEEAVTSAPRLAGAARPRSETLRQDAASRVRRLVRRSMVLQILRVRAVAVTARFSGRLAAPEAPLQSYAEHPAPRIAEGLAIVRRSVAAIRDDASAAGARVAVVLMPARFQVDDADYGRLRDAVAQSGGQLRRDAATERFDRTLADTGIARFDVLPALRRALPGPDLFFQQTVHLTPRGHEVVAEALDQFLQQSGLLDERPVSVMGR